MRGLTSHRGAVTLVALLTLVVCGVAACASSPKAPPARDLVAKTSVVPDGFARLYVYRAGRSTLGSLLGGRSLNDVHVDGQFLGTIEDDRYVMTHLKAGSYVLTVKVRRAVHLSVDTQGSTTVQVEAGRTYYVRVKPSGTWDHPPEFMPVPPSEGAEALQGCFLASGEHYY